MNLTLNLRHSFDDVLESNTNKKKDLVEVQLYVRFHIRLLLWQLFCSL